MTAELISAEAVAVMLTNDEIALGSDAAQIIRSLLLQAGLEPWVHMEIELFPGSGGTLLMARRTDLVSVCYGFEDAESLLSAAEACPLSWPSQLYGYKDGYYLMLRRPMDEESPDLEEFCLGEKPGASMMAHIREHGRLLIERDATAVLQKIFR